MRLCTAPEIPTLRLCSPDHSCPWSAVLAEAANRPLGTEWQLPLWASWVWVHCDCDPPALSFHAEQTVFLLISGGWFHVLPNHKDCSVLGTIYFPYGILRLHEQEMFCTVLSQSLFQECLPLRHMNLHLSIKIWEGERKLPETEILFQEKDWEWSWVGKKNGYHRVQGSCFR